MSAEVSGTSCRAVGDSSLVCAGERISFEDLVADDNFMLTAPTWNGNLKLSKMVT